MDFAYGETVFRDRRKRVTDPYNPARTTWGPWDDLASTITLAGTFIASSSSTALSDARRTQVSDSKSLYCTDTAVDVQVGDRIRRGPSTYYVNELPEADTNPFTGWRPAVEIPLERTEG